MTFIHSKLTRTAAALGTSATLAVAAGFVAAPAHATLYTDTFLCDGVPTQITVAGNNSSENGGWGAGRISSGTLIPTSFTFSAYDDTAGQYLFDPQGSQKGMGHANPNQATITCTQSMTATLADLIAENGQPPMGLPDWASPTDIITQSFIVTAVPVA